MKLIRPLKKVPVSISLICYFFRKSYWRITLLTLRTTHTGSRRLPPLLIAGSDFLLRISPRIRSQHRKRFSSNFGGYLCQTWYMQKSKTRSRCNVRLAPSLYTKFPPYLPLHKGKIWRKLSFSKGENYHIRNRWWEGGGGRRREKGGGNRKGGGRRSNPLSPPLFFSLFSTYLPFFF